MLFLVPAAKAGCTPAIVLPSEAQPTLAIEDGGGAPRFEADSNGLLVGNRSRSTQISVHGYVQGDWRLFSSDLQDRSHSVLLFRRIRPLVDASLSNHVRFRFIPDFGQNNPAVQEIYAEWTPTSSIHLRFGKFKAPLGLESLRQDRVSLAFWFGPAVEVNFGPPGRVLATLRGWG